MKKINILLGISFIAVSAYIYTGNGPKTTSLLFLLIGVASIILDLVFSSNEPYDERQKEIKSRSGHLAYLISVFYLFGMLLLTQYGVITNPIIAMFVVLAAHVLTFPIVSMFYSRKI